MGAILQTPVDFQVTNITPYYPTPDAIDTTINRLYCFRMKSYHLIITSQNKQQQSLLIEDKNYEATITSTTTGYIRRGDRVWIKNNFIGNIIGFGREHPSKPISIIVSPERGNASAKDHLFIGNNITIDSTFVLLI